MKRTDFIISGGDMRMVYAAERLSARHSAALYGFDGADTRLRDITGDTDPGAFAADCAVLPIFAGSREIKYPLSGRDELLPWRELLTRYLKPGGIVFAGRVFPELEGFCAEKGFALYDYLSREELEILNAVPTAEGALAAAIRETDAAVHGANVLITGFGRIGKLTARYFSALGADVACAARKKRDLAWVTALGYRAVSFSDETELRAALGNADILINTAPAVILTAERAACLRGNTVLIELAPSDCFTDSSVLPAGVKLVTARGLPGKVAPVTAGHIIADTIENILTERSNENGGA